MSLTKREEQDVLWKLKRADTNQVRRFKDQLGSYRAADTVFEKLKEQSPEACPDCGVIDNIIKYGQTTNNRQRFKCSDCGRTFIKNYDLPFYHSHYSEETWKSFFSAMIRGATLTELAEMYDINIETAFNWRHKLLWVIRQLEEQTVLAGRIWADETNVRQNKPGIPGGDSGQISLLAARDYEMRTVIKPVSDSPNATGYSLNQTLRGHVYTEDSTLVTDRTDSYNKFCRENSVGHESFESKNERLAMIDWLHSHFKNWFRQFRGVGTRYLSNYCAWYTFLRSNERIRTAEI